MSENGGHPMTTQATKPERARTVKIEPGVRVELDGLKGRIIERSRGDCWTVLWTGQGGSQWTTEWRETSFFTRSDVTYLGPTEPEGGDAAPPAPAAGQRWRTPKGQSLWGLTPNAVFTLTGYNDAFGCWKVTGPSLTGDIVEGWNAPPEAFADGRMAFVDHGESASPPSQPRTGPTGPIKAHGSDRCAHGNSHHCAPCDINRAKSRIALDNLAAKTGPANHATIVFAPPPAPSVRAILQSRERARQAKREEDARAVAAFVSDWELLRDA